MARRNGPSCGVYQVLYLLRQPANEVGGVSPVPDGGVAGQPSRLSVATNQNSVPLHRAVLLVQGAVPSLSLR
jgi:hypothetical protein